MMHFTRHQPTLISLCSVLLLLTIAGLSACGDSKSDTSTKAPEFVPDTSYLDELAKEEGVDQKPTEPDPSTTQMDQSDDRAADTQAVDDQVHTAPASPPQNQYRDEKRVWVREQGSKSIFGRSRDRAIDVGQRMQGSTEPENGLAMTNEDDEYAQAAGFAWDMPVDWRMAVPGSGRFAEMFVENPLGNASVSFTKETRSLAQIKRALESMITSSSSGRSVAQITKKTVLDFPITIFDLEGTYLNPADRGTKNETPFYAIHAAVIELPTTKVLIEFWGPQDTVRQNLGKFDAMIEQMYEK